MFVASIVMRFLFSGSEKRKIGSNRTRIITIWRVGITRKSDFVRKRENRVAKDTFNYRIIIIFAKENL